jgi:hypothetical protein
MIGRSRRIALAVWLLAGLAIGPVTGLTGAALAQDQAALPPALAQLVGAAEAGDAQAQLQLARLYDDGRDVPRSYADAARWYRAAAEQGSAAAQNRLGQYLYEGLGIARDTDAAIALLRQAADSGESAQYALDLAVALEKLEDWAGAASAYAQAAEAGSLDAAVSLGVLYQGGQGVPQDFDRARMLYEPAAEAGHPRALNNLGLLYVRGDGVPQDYEKAAGLFQQSADGGLKQGMSNLGVMYENGFGVEQSDTLAMDWYRRAGQLEQIGVEGAPTLAYDPRLLPFDPGAPEFERHRSGAARGDPVDQFILGFAILQSPDAPGTAVREGAALMQAAAEAGHIPAMANLGVLYFEGRGVPQDFLLGYHWLTLASAAGFTEAELFLDRYAGRMTPQLITQAQARAAQTWERLRLR